MPRPRAAECQRLRLAGRATVPVVTPSPGPRGNGWNLAVWTIVIAAAAALSVRLPSVLQGGADAIPGGGSDRVTRMIRERFGAGTLYQFPVVVHTDSLDSGNPSFGAAIERLTASLSAAATITQSAWGGGRHTSPDIIPPCRNGHSSGSAPRSRTCGRSPPTRGEPRAIS